MERKFLVIVDMQNDFVTGSLGSKEARAIIPNAVKRIKECEESGYVIYATQDTHYEDYLSTPEGKKLPVPHCIQGTKGWDLNPEIKEALTGHDYNAVIKPTFGSESLIDRLWGEYEMSDFKECEMVIEVIGLCTDICVISNVLMLKANFPDAVIRVNASCCAGVTPELHEAALKVMKSCQIDII